MDYIGEDIIFSFEVAVDTLKEDLNVLNKNVKNLTKTINKNKKDIARIRKVGNEAIDKLNELIVAFNRSL